MKRRLLAISLLFFACSVYAGDYEKTEPLPDTNKTVIDEPLYYPGGEKAAHTLTR